MRFRLHPTPPRLRVYPPMFRHHPLIPPLQRRPRMHPVRLPLLHPLTLTQRHPRALMMAFQHHPLIPHRLRFQHLPLLTLTRHRLRGLRLTFHPLTLAPITPRRVMLRRPHMLALRTQATWRRPWLPLAAFQAPMLPRQGREDPRRVQALAMGRRDRLAATTAVVARVAVTPPVTAARRPCLLLTRLRASLTRNETTRTRRPHTMPPLTAALTLRQLARLWPTLSARCLTLRLA